MSLIALAGIGGDGDFHSTPRARRKSWPFAGPEGGASLVGFRAGRPERNIFRGAPTRWRARRRFRPGGLSSSRNRTGALRRQNYRRRASGLARAAARRNKLNAGSDRNHAPPVNPALYCQRCPFSEPFWVGGDSNPWLKPGRHRQPAAARRLPTQGVPAQKREGVVALAGRAQPRQRLTYLPRANKTNALSLTCGRALQADERGRGPGGHVALNKRARLRR